MLHIIISMFSTLWPVHFLRVFFLRTLLRFKISGNSRIGFFNIFRVKSCEILNSSIGSFNIFHADSLHIYSSRIGHLNRFKFLKSVELKKGSWIKNRNSFIGTRVNTEEKRQGHFTLGEESLITYSHYFDITGGIEIGENVVFGGLGTQVWSHGFDHLRNLKVSPVSMGNNIYIGSKSLILQGVIICNNVTIGAGTTVSKRIVKSGFYISAQQELKKEY